jgi:hypothetical protein
MNGTMNIALTKLRRKESFCSVEKIGEVWIELICSRKIAEINDRGYET